MQKNHTMKTKLIAVFLVFAMVFSLFPGINEVVAATPDDIGVLYERVRENGVITNRLTLYAPLTESFKNPTVLFGGLGVKAVIESSDDREIVITDDTSLAKLASDGKIFILNNDGKDNMAGTGILFDISKVPNINAIAPTKAYVDEPLTITGTGFDEVENNILEYKLTIQDTPYTLNAAMIDPGSIKIDKALSGNPKSHDITLSRNVPSANDNRFIITTLKNSISIVRKIDNIVVTKIDPNSGPQNRQNVINIYGDVTNNKANFDSSMKIYVKGKNGDADIQGVNLGTITNSGGAVIGLKVRLPIYTKAAGVVDLLLTDQDGYNELLIPNGFIFMNIGNFLTVEEISPNKKKESELLPATIKGKNIGFFDPNSYDKMGQVVTPVGTPGYKAIVIAGAPQFNNTDTFKVEYSGTYENKPVRIIREIAVFIDGEVKIAPAPAPDFTSLKDTFVVTPLNVNLNPNQPKQVDVTVKTTTTILEGSTIHYSRVEEDTLVNGYTYIPDELAPEITSITPDYGPEDKDIYMTIKGKDFQVYPSGVGPTVTIGSRTVPAASIKVYDDQNRLVDGKKYDTGTKLKFILPMRKTGDPSLSGAMDVVVENPSLGRDELVNGFTFKTPNNKPDMPKIHSVKEPHADIRGGAITKEKVLITGENIFLSNDNSRVLITIDGEKATIDGKVSSDGKTVTIIPPPGTVPGKTKLQLINQDGSLAEIDFEYKLIITEPKITKIVPTKGSKGTKLVIKGQDFVLPDHLVTPDDPKRKGTVVLLGGKELNAYNYLPSGTITNPGNSIYYKDTNVDGKMITVVDSTTIYVDIPDKFYSFDSSIAAPYLKSVEIPQGDLTVEVLNPDGAKSKEVVNFEYVKPGTNPKILSATPDSGSTLGGTVVRIIGEDFQKSANEDIKVYFGAELATKVDYINSNEIIAQVPKYPNALPQGTDQIIVPLMVMNFDGAMAVYNKGFTYRIPGSKPVIDSLSPNRGSAAGGEKIVISGDDFRRKGDNDGEPIVYFNGIQAVTKWVDGHTLTAIAPPSKKDGPVDVVVVNHDAGAFTYKSYTYEISKPTITAITPGVMDKKGGTKLQINGTGFVDGDLSKLLEGESVDRHLPAGQEKVADTVIDNLVIFGDASTNDRKIIDTVRGLTYVDINDIKVEHRKLASDYSIAVITISKVNGGAGTINRSVNIPVGSSHLFIVNGAKDLGDPTLGDEGVLVEVTPSQVIVTRRVAAYAKWENGGKQITTIAPAVGGIDLRNIYVKNADGGTATSSIQVLNPSSQPTITYISPRNKVKKLNGTIADYTGTEDPADVLEYYTYTPLDGGAFLTINGSDFRRNVKVYLGDKLLEVVSRSVNDNQLVVKVPPGTTQDLNKLYRIVVVNEDGATADSSTISKPHYIVYMMPESNPIIERVTPQNTSSKGQNIIKILGDDFRPGIKVLIDGIESPSVTMLVDEYIDGVLSKKYNALAVEVPLGITPGRKTIQVINTDFGFDEMKDAITIISSPNINSVIDVKKNIPLSPIVFSINGGQSIRLTGEDYMPGARVIIGGTLKPKAELKQGETGIPCYNINDAEMVIVGGVAATNVKIDNSTSLTFTTPKLTMGNASIIVVNSDGGVSNVINTDYQKPVPDAPSGLSIEVVDSDTIKLEWSEVEGTNHYELYAAYSKDGSIVDKYVYVGSLKAYEFSEGRLRYFVDGLKASSWYSFKIKSVNDYGPSSFSPSTSFVKTKDKKITTYYQVVGDYQSGIAQNDRTSTLGSSLTLTVGEKSLGSFGSGLVVHFNQSNYNAYNPKIVDIGLEILRKYPSNRITLNEKDFTLKMMSNNLLVKETIAVPVTKVPDTKMSIIVNKDLKAKGDEIRLKLPKGYKAITNPVGINLAMQVEQSKTNIKGLNGNADLSFNVSDEVKRRYPGGLYIAYYNNVTKKLEILSAQSIGTVLTTKTTKSGEYMLIGKFTR